MASSLNNNWNSLIKPSKVVYDSKNESSEKLANIVIEPLERGFGLTLGNALRRVLLSSLRGTAIIGIRIPGVAHEFSAKSGIKEDLIDVILNLKKVSVKSHSGENRILRLNVKGPCVVTAGMITTSSDIEILTPNQTICTVSENADLEMEIFCETGKGYLPASAQEKKDHPAGFIAIDGLFSPIKKVSYKVEDTRIGQTTDYDKLSMSVETDGSITPEIAIGLASKILQQQLQTFICFPDEEDSKQEKEKELEYDPILLKKVDDLELSVRSINCLRNDNIVYIGDLVTRTEAEMLRTQNFGRKSLNEIKDLLSKHNLKFNMDIPGWPPENIEELAKKYQDNY